MYIHVKVTTKAKKESVIKVADDRLLIHVRESAERNHANKRILEIVRRLYPGKQVRIVSGHRSPSKVISIG